MSDRERDGPYIYQPYGVQHKQHWASGKIYAIAGLSPLTTVKGLTKVEADAVLACLKTSEG